MSSAKVKKNLEAVAAINWQGVSATEAASARLLCRTVAEEPEAGAELKATASYWADELGRVPDRGQAERREYLVRKAAFFAQNAVPTA